MAIRLSRPAFEEIVLEEERSILALLPQELRKEAASVLVEVRNRPARRQREELRLRREQTLLGLFVGVPLVERHADTVLLQPDRIVLYREPIQDLSHSPQELRGQIRETLIHELAHFFGRSDEELARLACVL
jgi:predicted Zn-dependent protease with MMP-like domain